MGLEGRLTIDVSLTADGVSHASIASNRPVHAATVLRGRSRTEVQKTLPLLFNVCGTAQACASVRALEQASGVDVDDAIERQRDALVNLETLREHLWRVLLDWPLFVDEQPARAAMAEVASLQREMTAALSRGGDVFAFGGTEGNAPAAAISHERLQALVSEQVLGIPAADWLGINSVNQLVAWIDDQDRPVTRLLHRVTSMKWDQAGACDVSPLPELSNVDVERAMRDTATVERPQWQGECRETSSLTRNDSDLLRDLMARLGNGLLTRLVARLHEVAMFTHSLMSKPRSVRLNPLAEQGLGVGRASAARGQLFHRVELDGDCVTDYRILAPTEWNFHPAGVVRRALSVLKGGAEQIEQQARLLVTAIDPCVGYDLRMAEARAGDA